MSNKNPNKGSKKELLEVIILLLNLLIGIIGLIKEVLK